MKILDSVAAVLDALGAPFALVGGRAVIARGYIRATLDYDFLTPDLRILDPASWATLSAAGARVDCRRGAFDDPIAGVARLTFPDGDQADVLLAKWKWETAVVERAEPVMVEGRTILVPRTGDLILLKLAAGGVIDVQDATMLLRHGDREALIADVERHLPHLDRDAHAAWERVKADSVLPR
jgi:hypothetical protein